MGIDKSWISDPTNPLYHRFTDRAKVMQLANQEAQRLNHEHIGTEHVLLGLVKEGYGVAANVLKSLGADVRTMRRAVEKMFPKRPDAVTPGKLTLTPRARTVIKYSMEEARNLNHNYVGTEHILLGLVRERERGSPDSTGFRARSRENPGRSGGDPGAIAEGSRGPRLDIVRCLEKSLGQRRRCNATPTVASRRRRFISPTRNTAGAFARSTFASRTRRALFINGVLGRAPAPGRFQRCEAF